MVNLKRIRVCHVWQKRAVFSFSSTFSVSSLHRALVLFLQFSFPQGFFKTHLRKKSQKASSRPHTGGACADTVIGRLSASQEAEPCQPLDSRIPDFQPHERDDEKQPLLKAASMVLRAGNGQIREATQQADS